MDPEKLLAKIKEMVGEVKTALTKQVEDVSANTTKGHDELKAELETKLIEIDEKQKKLEEDIRERNVTIGMNKKEVDKFNFGLAYKGLCFGDWSESGFEKEILDAAKQKSVSAGDGASGGYVIADELLPDIVGLPIASMPIPSMGITTMSGLVGNIRIPTLTARPDTAATAEQGVPSELNYTFGEINLNPKRESGYTKVSNLALRQNAVALDSYIRQQLSTSLKVGMHKRMVSGTGTNKQGKGILNYNSFTSTSAIGTNGGRFTYDKAMEMKTNIEEADVDLESGSFGFLMRSIVLEGMRLEKVAQYSGDTGGQFQIPWPVMVNEKAIETAVMSPIKKTTHIPKNVDKGTSTTLSSVIYGDWSQFILGLWSGAQLRASTEAAYGSNSAFLQDETWLIVDQYYDLALKYEPAFTKITDAETTRTSW